MAGLQTHAFPFGSKIYPMCKISSDLEGLSYKFVAGMVPPMTVTTRSKKLLSNDEIHANTANLNEVAVVQPHWPLNRRPVHGRNLGSCP